jgi:hypothetical protein
MSVLLSMETPKLFSESRWTIVTDWSVPGLNMVMTNRFMGVMFSLAKTK